MNTRAEESGIDLDLLSINTIRGLCMDMVERAGSGHPGTPMDIAPVAYTLWQRYLRFDPQDPIWPNRDRFVLSEGHASTLLWSLLHLSGVLAVEPDYEILGERAVSIDDMKSFRELGSRCPGHPEYRWTSGVEATTGPLGQGVATSVGMALAGRWLADHFNRHEFTMFDFDVYALAGDGCMMEGVSSEAASFAAHQRLANLCWIYDCNRVTIEGHIDLTFTEDVAARFLAYGWNVVTIADANDVDLIARALHSFRAEHSRPTLILVHSHIGYGSPVEDSPKAHGEPLGPEGVRSTKRFLGMPEDREFYIPERVYGAFEAGVSHRGLAARSKWEKQLESYADLYPELARELGQMQRRELPEDWDRALLAYPTNTTGLASRVSSGEVLNAFAEAVPWVIGGAADLAPSTMTHLVFDGAGELQTGEPGGRNIHFGIREHASAAIANGIALTKVRPFWSTFFIFSDYARPAIRLSALMEIPVIHIFTHDSIGVGQDGPTHQPVEQLASLRAMPGLLVFRPADANEVVEMWRIVATLQREPAALVLTRQALPTLDRTIMAPATGVARGAYVLVDPDAGPPELILLATGSEVHLALEAKDALGKHGVQTRVVSMPCWELFERQTQAYRNGVLPPAITARVAIEQASTFGWERYVGDDGAVVGMHTFGASAPLKALLTKYGFTKDVIVHVAQEVLAKQGRSR
ncbi:MAG TPA: transketolase [Acidimicrobiales bacterium]|nr:transketolase [Acidimicrobiales bacterium]